MKAIKFLLTTTLMLAYLCSVNAQGLYIEPGVSYMMPSTNEVLGPKNQNVLTPGSEIYSNVVGSYGAGTSLDLTVGYMLSRNFGVEIGTSYVLGNETLIEEFTDGSSYDRSYATNQRLTLSPGFLVDAGGETFSPFARFSLLIPVAGQTDGFRESNAPVMVSSSIPLLFPTANGFEATSIAKGEFSLGFNAAFGLRYQLNDMVGIFASVGYTGLRIARKSYEVPGAILKFEDGTELDVLPLLAIANNGSASDIYAYEEYVDELSAEELAALQEQGINDYNENPVDYPDVIDNAVFLAELAGAGSSDNVYTTYGSKDLPALKTRQDVSFSTVNISIGARFLFGGGNNE